MQVKTDVSIRWMIRRDFPQVLEIEWDSFDVAWCEEDFIKCLRQRNCIGMVAELAANPREIVGFMIYELHKSRLEVLNFAVAREYRRQAVGRQMVERLQCKLSPQRRREIIAVVREKNLAGQLFFKVLGFRATGVLRGHFYDDEDGYRMLYRIHPENVR